jgi:enoyl-CoA hydratase/carnithine racemase
MTDQLRTSVPGDDIEPSAIKVSRPRPGVALLTIASEPLGVLRLAVKRAMRQALTTLEADATVRCVVVAGTGKAFSVGSDIKEFKLDAGWLLEAEREENALNAQIETARFPVIAACNGYTLGGGAVLALACDIRIAAASAKFGLPEVQLGAFASGSGTQRLAHLVGRGRALYLLLTGRILPAEEAKAFRLVEEVVADETLIERALELATAIAVMPPSAVAASKRCVNLGMRYGWDAGIALESQLAVEVGLSGDAEEGRRAFIEKRPPRFSGR